jgi:chromate transporter
VKAITAAVVGVVLNLALWFALHVVFQDVQTIEVMGASPELPVLSSVNGWAALLAAAAMLAMLRFKMGMIPTLGACASAGIAIRVLVT